MIEHHKPSQKELTQSHLEAMRNAGIPNSRQLDQNKTVGGYTGRKMVSHLSEDVIRLTEDITLAQQKILGIKQKKA
jgi:hypothetical protein